MKAQSTPTNPLWQGMTRVAIVTGLALLLPLIAMQLSDDMAWTLGDFVAAGILLFSTGTTYVLATRMVRRVEYRVIIGVSLAAILLLVWAELAVGIFD